VRAKKKKIKGLCARAVVRPIGMWLKLDKIVSKPNQIKREDLNFFEQGGKHARGVKIKSMFSARIHIALFIFCNTNFSIW
jgi:hypothetical protein